MGRVHILVRLGLFFLFLLFGVDRLDIESTKYLCTSSHLVQLSCPIGLVLVICIKRLPPSLVLFSFLFSS